MHYAIKIKYTCKASSGWKSQDDGPAKHALWLYHSASARVLISSLKPVVKKTTECILFPDLYNMSACVEVMSDGQGQR